MNHPARVLLLLLSQVPGAMAADHPLLPGYLDYPELTERLQSLAQHEHVRLHSLGRTTGDREIHQLTIAQGEPESRPAILIMGGLDAKRPVDSELAVRLAEKIASETDVLDRLTFYVIPRANPDGVERVFQRPYRDSSGNAQRTDDDRDGSVGEDGPEDLDGDGMITAMRVYRTGGAFRADPDDPRLHVAAEPAEGKPGEFDVFVEGIDNDDDEAWNEDRGDGVAFNRNFSFQYQPFQLQTGPHAVSEVETRAVADFVWDHPHIAVVFCLGRHDNLTEAWKVNSQDRGRVRTSVTREDADYFGYVAKQFQEVVKLEAGASQPLDGSWLAWSYFHFGRWAFGSSCWRIPKEQTDERGDKQPAATGAAGGSSQPGAESSANSTGNQEAPNEEEPPRSATERPFPRGRRLGERRGRPGMGRLGGESPPAGRGARQTSRDTEEDRMALRWMDSQKIDGFTPWTTLDHPDFPGLRVDVGGMRPWWRENPPVGVIDELAENHLEFVKKLATLLPRLEIESLTRESLGHGIFRISATIANPGYLPTCTDLGDSGRLTYPVQVELILPEGAKTLTEPVRRRSSAIKGGGTVKHVWLVQVADSNTVQVTVRASSIMVGSATAELDLSPASPGETP